MDNKVKKRLRTKSENFGIKLFEDSNEIIKPDHELQRTNITESDNRLNETSDFPIIGKLISETAKEICVNDEEDEIPPSVKEKYGSHLSKLIEEQIVFIDMDNKLKKKLRTKSGINDGVKLFKDSKEIIKLDHELETNAIPQKRITIKRHCIEREQLTESEKLKASSISSDLILSKKETESWSKRTKGEFESYKCVHSLLHPIEPITEFTELKNKNDWFFKKISRNYKPNIKKKKKM